MSDSIIWISLTVFILGGVPIFVSLGMSTLIALHIFDIGSQIVPLDLVKVSDMFPLLAIPCFIFAGVIMEKGDMARRIVDVCSIFIGKVHGGLGLVTILGCMFFSSMIGSGPGTVAAMGALMYPSMIRNGYGKNFSAGVCATGGTLGILIPPSNPMIMYAVTANVSIGDMFLAGVIPGMLVCAVLMVVTWYTAKQNNYISNKQSYEKGEIKNILVRGMPSLMAPVIILGGIYGGIFTAIEASAVAVLYALFVGIVVHKELKISDIISSLKMTNINSSNAMIIVGVSVLFGRFITMQEIPQQVTESMLTLSSNPYVIMMLIATLLFFLGMFMETLSTIVILVPILLPVVLEVGINPIHFGIVWIIANEVALLTPPLGGNNFVMMNIAGLSLENVAKGTIRYVVTLVILTIAIIFMEDVATFLPIILK